MRKYKYLIIISILVFILSIAGSYAWFAYSAENTVAIKGNIVAIDADLTVDLVVGTNEEMVPLIDEALPNALNAVGTTNGACVDSQGNLSCQVYKITLTNNGSRLKNLKGTVELYAKSGSTYQHLKWRELTNTTTIKEGSTINDMEKSVLVNGLTIESKETLTWYIAVWISEIDSDQTNTDKGDFGGTVTFEVVDSNSNGLNEYGFYFGQPYSGTMNEITVTYVFYEDGSLDALIDGSVVESAPAGSFSYSYKTIEMDGSTVGEVSEDGKEIYFPDENITMYLEEVITISGNLASETKFIADVMVANARSDKNIDFSKTSEESGTNGVYVVHSTIDDDYPIFYYRGAVEDNNLIFANFCWKVVRTTETGGVKLIYNGTPTDGQCNNTDEASVVSTLPFNTNDKSPAYVGYMYGNPYTSLLKSMSNITDTYYYGNDVTYSNGTYTLTDTITSNSWDSVYASGLDNNHYTCFSTSSTCSEVYYIYNTTGSDAYYITLTGGKKVETALSEMLDYNTNSSTIKGNATTEGTLDYWYSTNIAPSYSGYIEDTIWCNDRSIAEKSGWNPDGGTMRDALYFSPAMRAINGTPSLSCERDIDKFTESPANGNGDLDYPVGLLTADEAILAGGVGGEGNTFYLNLPNYGYWLGSPASFYDFYYAYGFFVDKSVFAYFTVDFEFGVRPSVSLKPGFTIVDGGTGTTSNPYVVE